MINLFSNETRSEFEMSLLNDASAISLISLVDGKDTFLVLTIFGIHLNKLVPQQRLELGL